MATPDFIPDPTQFATLTADDLKILKRPFPFAGHEFKQGFVYLTEEAIADRIEEVDPAWSFELQRVEHNGDDVVVCARLTIKNVSREGVGMQKFNPKSGEAEKGAATDALKRCARLFGVGRYLLDAPQERDFDNWLNGKLGKPQNQQQQQQQRPASVNGVGIPHTSSETKRLEKMDNTLDMPQIGNINMTDLLNDAIKEKLVKQRNHFINVISLLKNEGSIRDAMNAAQVLEVIRQHEAQKVGA